MRLLKVFPTLLSNPAPFLLLRHLCYCLLLRQTTPQRSLCVVGHPVIMPDPLALSDCYTINPLDATPTWQSTDSLPNGPQTMSDGILLPDGTVLIINGGRIGSGGGFMVLQIHILASWVKVNLFKADNPVFQPVIYDPTAAAGSRFTTMPGSSIPRLYHSTAILLPSGEVLVAGSNPAVGYSANGRVSGG